jgi:hypothetical protein
VREESRANVLPLTAIAPFFPSSSSHLRSEKLISRLDSFNANPCNGEDGLEGDDEEETFFVATAEDVAAWEAGLSAPPRPAHRELCYADGGRYLGETLGGLRHGRGTLECTNGDTYEGVWRLGLRHGKGKAVFPSRRTKGGDDVGYDGDWLDDKADG